MQGPYINRELRGTARSLYKIDSTSSPTYPAYKNGEKYSQTKVNFWAPTVEHTKSMKLVQAQHSQTEVLVIQIIIKDLMQEKLVKEVYASAIISTPWKEQLSKKKNRIKK